MQSSVLQGILLPFWGTSLGAACVFCLQRAPSAVLRRVLEGSAVLDENLPERVAAVPDPAFMQMLKRELTSVRRLLAGQ